MSGIKFTVRGVFSVHFFLGDKGLMGVSSSLVLFLCSRKVWFSRHVLQAVIAVSFPKNLLIFFLSKDLTLLLFLFYYRIRQ